MRAGPISIPAAAAALPGPWRPRELATANEAVIRIARLGRVPETLQYGN